jgi:hypothetical protein
MITHAETQAERQEASRGSNRGRDVLEPRDPHSPLETDVLGGLSITERERPGTRLQPLKFDVGIFSHTYAEALVPGLQRGLAKEQRVFLANGKMGRADRVRYFRDADGDVIGVHVFEIKPNTKWHMDRGEEQAAEYLAGLKKEFEEKLRAKGKTPSEVLPDGTNAWDKQVLTYDRDKMRSVLRALRGSRRDAAQLERLEAIARQVFETPH